MRHMGLGKLPYGVLVCTIEVPYFFGTVENFEQTLEEAIESMQKRGITIRFCEANERVYEKLRKPGIIAMIGAHSYF